MRPQVLGVRFDALTVPEAADRALALTAAPRSAYLCTPNPEILWLCRKDAALRSAIAGADMTLADGAGIVWAARTLGDPLPGRAAGYDTLLALLERFTGRIYLLGGKPGVAERAGQAIPRRYPAVPVAGCRDGYFSDPAPVVADIASSGAALSLVCLGSPKQELFMAAAKDALPRGLMMGLGGSLDVLAGDAPRAPERWRAAGLEWLYRLLRQPWRIGRMPRLAGFVAAVLAEKYKRRGS